MFWILEGAAFLCLVYYGVIVIYSGAATSFALFWPAMAIVFALLGAGVFACGRLSWRIPPWVPVSAWTVLGAIAVVFVVTEALIGWKALFSPARATEYLIVLGAEVRGEEPSNSLRKRLDKAIEYVEEYPNTVLVLSGGRGPGEEISEARVMFDYLSYNGVSAANMLIEDQSSDTVENIAFSRRVIERQEYNKAMAAQALLQDNYRRRSENDRVRVGVLTSNYHLFRAEAIARKQGIVNPVGVAAPGDRVLALHLWVREGLAVLKDKFLGRM